MNQVEVTTTKPSSGNMSSRWAIFTKKLLRAEHERRLKREKKLLNKRESQRKYRQRPEYLKYHRESQRKYMQRPENREKKQLNQREYRQRPEYLKYRREYRREYMQRPGNREKHRERQRKYYYRGLAKKYWSDPGKWLKRDEQKVKEFLETHFGKVFIYNRAVTKDSGIHCTDSATNRYPDFLFDSGFYPVIVEADENQHRGAGYSCDYTRMAEIAAAMGSQCIFIRYHTGSECWDELKAAVTKSLAATWQSDVAWEKEAYDQISCTYIGYTARGLERAAKRKRLNAGV